MTQGAARRARSPDPGRADAGRVPWGPGRRLPMEAGGGSYGPDRTGRNGALAARRQMDGRRRLRHGARRWARRRPHPGSLHVAGAPMADAAAATERPVASIDAATACDHGARRPRCSLEDGGVGDRRVAAAVGPAVGLDVGEQRRLADAGDPVVLEARQVRRRPGTGRQAGADEGQQPRTSRAPTRSTPSRTASRCTPRRPRPKPSTPRLASGKTTGCMNTRRQLGPAEEHAKGSTGARRRSASSASPALPAAARRTAHDRLHGQHPDRPAAGAC